VDHFHLLGVSPYYAAAAHPVSKRSTCQRRKSRRRAGRDSSASIPLWNLPGVLHSQLDLPSKYGKALSTHHWVVYVCVCLQVLRCIPNSFECTFPWHRPVTKLAHGGNCNNVPLEFSNPHLGKWLKNQRTSYHEGQLEGERRDRLHWIGVHWREYERTWEFRFHRLLEYKETEGDCNVPSTFRGSNLPLSKCMGYQPMASEQQ
jgi:hypothetical protein